MTPVSWDKFADDVEKLLPALAPRFSRARPLWGDEPIPSHIVLGDIVVPALIDAAEKRNASLVKRIVDLLTSLAESTDDRLQELVMVSFIEFMIGDQQLEAKLKQHLTAPLLSLAKQRRSWKPGNGQRSRYG
jgi:hypothetical protein